MQDPGCGALSDRHTARHADEVGRGDVGAAEEVADSVVQSAGCGDMQRDEPGQREVDLYHLLDGHRCLQAAKLVELWLTEGESCTAAELAPGIAVEGHVWGGGDDRLRAATSIPMSTNRPG